MGPMAERDWRRSLRGAIYRDDGMAVVALVRTGGLRDDALQLLGDEAARSADAFTRQTAANGDGSS